MSGEAKEDKTKLPDKLVVGGGEPVDPAKVCPSAPEHPAPDPKAAEKAEKSMQFVFVVAIVTIILVIAGIFGMRYLVPKEKPETVTYNQFTFTKMAGSWYTQWQYENELYTIPLRFNPYEVENVSVSGALDDSFNQHNVTYVAFDPSDSNMAYVALAAAELSINLAQVIGLNLTAACTTDNTTVETCINRTVARCGDDDKAVIYLREDNETKVTFDGKCITAQGSQLELVKAVDRLLYKWYGIMP